MNREIKLKELEEELKFIHLKIALIDKYLDKLKTKHQKIYANQ